MAMEQCPMSRIRVGDTVAFRQDVAEKCDSRSVTDYRAIVTQVAGNWLFMTEPDGRMKVMPASSMRRVGRNGVVFELVP